METNTQLKTVSLDVRTSRDPAALIGALEGIGVHAASRLQQRADGVWCVHCALRVTGATLEARTTAVLDGIERLTGEAREIWYVSALRELHLGFEIGTAPGTFSDVLASEVLSRAAAAGMSVRLTIVQNGGGEAIPAGP